MSAHRRPALLLLGGFVVAGNQRYLRAAADRGLAILIVDAPSPHVPALLAAWHGADLTEHALLAADQETAIVDRIAVWSDRYAIRGVCALREEYVEIAALAADLLGVPSPGLRAARVCRNKLLQRRYLAAWSPYARMVAPGDRAGISPSGWPAIVKPVARQASSGVRLVADPDEFAWVLHTYPPAEMLLVEHVVDGPEFSVESLSSAGEIRYLAVTRKRIGGDGYCVEVGHTTPAPDLGAEQRCRIEAVHRAVLERLDFGTGIAHAEYRLATDGAPVLIEIAARPPGDSIMMLHWLATGVSLEDAYVGLVVGDGVAAPPPPRRYARQVYLPYRPGVFDRLDVAADLCVPTSAFHPARMDSFVEVCGAAADRPTVRCVVALQPPGTVLRSFTESGDRAAMFVIDARTPAELDELERRCLAGIAVRVRR